MTYAPGVWRSKHAGTGCTAKAQGIYPCANKPTMCESNIAGGMHASCLPQASMLGDTTSQTSAVSYAWRAQNTRYCRRGSCRHACVPQRGSLLTTKVAMQAQTLNVGLRLTAFAVLQRAGPVCRSRMPMSASSLYCFPERYMAVIKCQTLCQVYVLRPPHCMES